MIHEVSAVRTGTKRSIPSSRFQHIQDHLIWTPYKGDITKTMQVSAESETNAMTELVMTCNLEKIMA